MIGQAFELKASLFTISILQLKTFDAEMIAKQLSNAAAQAPNFFQNAPVMLDLHRLQAIECPIDYVKIIEVLKSHQLIPISVTGGNADQQHQAVTAGLGVMPRQYSAKVKFNETSSKPTESSDNTLPRESHKTDQNACSFAKLIQLPVRSGQQIYAKNTDLIVVAPVSHGAELLADGSIHVYGTLRGRALAGVNGNLEARIFCQKLEAELLAIAGLYQLNEQFKEFQGKEQCQVSIEADKLCIKQLV